MSDRTSIGVRQTTKERLNALKEDGETWDGVVTRAIDALENESDSTYTNEDLATMIERLADKLESGPY